MLKQKKTDAFLELFFLINVEFLSLRLLNFYSEIKGLLKELLDPLQLPQFQALKENLLIIIPTLRLELQTKIWVFHSKRAKSVFSRKSYKFYIHFLHSVFPRAFGHKFFSEFSFWSFIYPPNRPFGKSNPSESMEKTLFCFWVDLWYFDIFLHAET